MRFITPRQCRLLFSSYIVQSKKSIQKQRHPALRSLAPPTIILFNRILSNICHQTQRLMHSTLDTLIIHTMVQTIHIIRSDFMVNNGNWYKTAHRIWRPLLIQRPRNPLSANCILLSNVEPQFNLKGFNSSSVAFFQEASQPIRRRKYSYI